MTLIANWLKAPSLLMSPVLQLRLTATAENEEEEVVQRRPGRAAGGASKARGGGGRGRGGRGAGGRGGGRKRKGVDSDEEEEDYDEEDEYVPGVRFPFAFACSAVRAPVSRKLQVTKPPPKERPNRSPHREGAGPLYPRGEGVLTQAAGE